MPAIGHQTYAAGTKSPTTTSMYGSPVKSKDKPRMCNQVNKSATMKQGYVQSASQLLGKSKFTQSSEQASVRLLGANFRKPPNATSQKSAGQLPHRTSHA